MVKPWHTAYAATKAGVHGLTLGLAVDLGPDGIRCNTVCPGWIDTELNRAYVEMHPDRSLIERELGQLHPVGRIGAPKGRVPKKYPCPPSWMRSIGPS